MIPDKIVESFSFFIFIKLNSLKMACHSTEGASEPLTDRPDQGHLERMTTTTKYYFII